MSMMNSTWNGQDHSMQAGQDDDFQQFLDMNGMDNMGDGMQFDFQDFHDGNGANNHMLPNQHRQTLDTAMSGTDTPDMLARSDPTGLHQMPAITSGVSYQSIPATMIPPPTPTEAIVNTIDAQIQFLQQQKLQHQLQEQQAALFAQQQQRIVPPTPQSLELQAGTHHYYSNHSQADQTPQQQPLDYRYQRLKEQQEMLFTPLVSPAVTPLDTHFPIDAQFTVPGAYFSPLTSPALHAQSDNMISFEHRHGSISHSPVKLDMESSPLSGLIPSSVESTKKGRKNATKRGKSSVRQSPITKPQRRKTATTPLLNEQVLSELVEAAEQEQQQLPLPALPTSASATPGTTDSDHNSSVSPEALHDSTLIDMPPPPIPKARSAKPSPFLAAQTHAHHLPGHVLLPGMPSPATPASLMKLSSPNNRVPSSSSGSQEPLAPDHIESFELPESANFPKAQPTPRIESRTPILTASDSSAKSSTFQPTHSPFIRPRTNSSATQSPQILPSSSSSERKTPLLAPRGNSKKRSSISSVHVSPALLPRISPNIKPLLPGGGPGGQSSAEDTTAASHLLATKSNYQRILEGNTVAGVSYPTELSTNLTSKRTSHKIAEQGRRNRINSALMEMATLLPPQGKKDPKEEAAEEAEREREREKKGGGGGGNVPNSKASTVELAIDYIKQLKREVEEANKRAEEAERKLIGVGKGDGDGDAGES
ncbi:hypothetical protein CONLIGDRAFT_30882 [Coniochaeta ligniaria NRRL 30616]|uniref:BHLH domain-containing protein n=1 Tax=Coniochaeta ligniaria NRRL 30616 TaxID=1408157 RepID=A0A1J7J477_9PEZI|nr:hypothetical protein CONLIGDRAFT_30882 [Coniochaeta ligniaria NRRL 30616]